VTKRDEERLWKLQFELRRAQQLKRPVTRNRYKITDTVRISHLRQSFDREYDERWTNEHFVVRKRGTNQGIPYYELEDTQGEKITGTFYQQEFNKVKVTKVYIKLIVTHKIKSI